MPNQLITFKVPANLIRTHPELVADLMSGLVVVRAEMLYHAHVIDYVALDPRREGSDVSELPRPMRVVHTWRTDPKTGDTSVMGLCLEPEA